MNSDTERKQKERARKCKSGLRRLNIDRWVDAEYYDDLKAAVVKAYEKEFKRLAKLAGQSGA